MNMCPKIFIPKCGHTKMETNTDKQMNIKRHTHTHTHLGILEVLHILHLPGVLAEASSILCQGGQVCLRSLEDLREEMQKSFIPYLRAYAVKRNGTLNKRRVKNSK